MHRQIAGKLTGPVTKWIVLVVWSWSSLGPSASSSGKLADVQNNEAVLLAARRPPSPPRSSTSCPGPSTPTTSPRWSSTTASGGLTEADLRRHRRAGDRRSRKIDGVTDEGVLTPNGAARQAQGADLP